MKIVSIVFARLSTSRYDYVDLARSIPMYVAGAVGLLASVSLDV